MAEKAQAEPTMEEILASIRKIISDEGGDTAQDTYASRENETQDEPSVSVRTTEDEDFENLSLDDVIEKTGGNAEALGEEAGGNLGPIEQTRPEEEAFPGDISDSMFDEPETPQEPLHLGEQDRIPGDPDDTGEDLDDFDLDVMSFEEPEGAVAAADDTPVFEEPAESGWDTGLAEAEPEPEAVEPTTIMPEPEPAPAPKPAPAATAHDESAAPASKSETVSRASEGLTDDRIAGAAASALGKLMVKERRKTDDDGDPNTVEGLLRQMLRPMIKEWLDANLPDIVERKVEEEVQRIARMAR